MLLGGQFGGLEVRREDGGATILRGAFPYNKIAVLSDGGRNGRPRKEKIASRAFGYRVAQPDENIHLLVGHDYNKPLASKAAGTLKLTDTDAALLIEAIVTREIAATSYAADALAGIAAGIALGLSPGFRIPPERAVKDAEQIEQEEIDPAKGKHGALIRTVLAALLFELSIVTVAAYLEAQIEQRNWTLPNDNSEDHTVRRILNRWRL